MTIIAQERKDNSCNAETVNSKFDTNVNID